MAKIGAHMREEFDPNRKFVVTRPFAFSGELLSRGDPFNKTWTTLRRLRQLYENRSLGYEGDINGMIVPTAEGLAPPGANEDGEPRFKGMTNTEITAWLQANHIVPRHNWKRPQLIERAKRAFQEKKSASSAA